MDNIPENLVNQLLTAPPPSEAPQYADTIPSVNIRPTPAFCLKTKSVDKGEKIFINVCTSEEMKAPRDVTDEELLEIIKKQDASQFRVPLSLGEPRTELDRAQNACTVYDIVVHPSLHTEAQTRDVMMEFLLLLIVEGVEAKYEVDLNREMRRMQHIKYMGTPAEHRIRIHSKPRIEMEESESGNSYSPLITEEPTLSNEPAQVAAPEPEYTLTKDPPKGHPDHIVMETKLPLVKSSKHMQLSVGEDRIVLTAQPNRYHLDLCLPYYVIPEEAGAQFNKKSRVLTLTMSVKKL